MKHSLIASLVGLSIASPVFSSDDSDSDDDKFVKRISTRRSAFDSDFFGRGFGTTFFRKGFDDPFFTSSERKTTTVTFDDGNTRMKVTTESGPEQQSGSGLDIRMLHLLNLHQKGLSDLEKVMLSWQQVVDVGGYETLASKKEAINPLLGAVESISTVLRLYEENKLLLTEPTRDAYETHARNFENFKHKYPILFDPDYQKDTGQLNSVIRLLESAGDNALIMHAAMKEMNILEAANQYEYIKGISGELNNNPFVIALKAGKFATSTDSRKSPIYSAILERIKNLESMLAELKASGFEHKLAQAKDFESSQAVPQSQMTVRAVKEGKMPHDPESLKKTLDLIIPSLGLVKSQTEQFGATKSALSADVIRIQENEKRANRVLISELDILFPIFEDQLHSFAYKDKTQRQVLFALFYDGLRQLNKLKKNYPYLVQTEAEDMELQEKQKISGLLDSLKATITVYLSGDREFMTDCLDHIRTAGKKLLKNPYVQQIMASTQDWTHSDVNSFQGNVLKIVRDINDILKRENAKAKIDDKGKEEASPRAPVTKQRSNSMEGIRVRAVMGDNEGIRVKAVEDENLGIRVFGMDEQNASMRITAVESPKSTSQIEISEQDVTASSKKSYTDEDLLASIGLKFSFYKPARILVETLSNMEDYIVMLPNLVKRGADKKIIGTCIRNAFQERENLQFHPYKDIRFKGLFETEQYHPGREEELQFRKKIDSSLERMTKALEEVVKIIDGRK